MLSFMTPFAFGLLRAVFWALPLFLGYLAGRVPRSRVRTGLLLAGVLLGLALRPPGLGPVLALLGFLLGLFPSGSSPGASKGRGRGR